MSRKSVLPVIKELNGLLFHPVQYEGEESSKNVFYTGAASNQQAIPATDYFLEELGVEKFAFPGTDYVYPRTTNNILVAYLQDKGIADSDIFVNHTPFGHSDWSKIVADVVALAADGKKVGVISTINGDANIGFYKELAAAGISAGDAWTDFLPESAVLESDWKDLGCGMYNTATKTCVPTLSNY